MIGIRASSSEIAIHGIWNSISDRGRTIPFVSETLVAWEKGVQRKSRAGRVHETVKVLITDKHEVYGAGYGKVRVKSNKESRMELKCDVFLTIISTSLVCIAAQVTTAFCLAVEIINIPIDFLWSGNVSNYLNSTTLASALYNAAFQFQFYSCRWIITLLKYKIFSV